MERPFKPSRRAKMESRKIRVDVESGTVHIKDCIQWLTGKSVTTASNWFHALPPDLQKSCEQKSRRFPPGTVLQPCADRKLLNTICQALGVTLTDEQQSELDRVFAGALATAPAAASSTPPSQPGSELEAAASTDSQGRRKSTAKPRAPDSPVPNTPWADAMTNMLSGKLSRTHRQVLNTFLEVRKAEIALEEKRLEVMRELAKGLHSGSERASCDQARRRENARKMPPTDCRHQTCHWLQLGACRPRLGKRPREVTVVDADCLQDRKVKPRTQEVGVAGEAPSAGAPKTVPSRSRGHASASETVSDSGSDSDGSTGDESRLPRLCKPEPTNSN
jgi:hypothetical protein